MRKVFFKLFDKYDWYHKRYCDVRNDLTWARSFRENENAKICSRHYWALIYQPPKHFNCRCGVPKYEQ